MYDYQSEITQFIDKYLESHPEEAQARLENRAILWDVSLDLEEEKQFKKAQSKRGAYAYQNE